MTKNLHMSKKSSTFAPSNKKFKKLTIMKKINLNEICVAKLEKKQVLGKLVEMLTFKPCLTLYGKDWEKCKKMLKSYTEYLKINTPDIAEAIEQVLSEMEGIERVLK